eukprot:3072832-Rhodomonas_salina.2
MPALQHVRYLHGGCSYSDRSTGTHCSVVTESRLGPDPRPISASPLSVTPHPPQPVPCATASVPDTV